MYVQVQRPPGNGHCIMIYMTTTLYPARVKPLIASFRSQWQGRIGEIWMCCPCFGRFLIVHFPTQAESCVRIDGVQDGFGKLKQVT